MHRTGRSANMLSKPSNDHDSAGLNWSELQRGHFRSRQSRCGNQLGQFRLRVFIFLCKGATTIGLLFLSRSAAPALSRYGAGISSLEECIAGAKRQNEGSRLQAFGHLRRHYGPQAGLGHRRSCSRSARSSLFIRFLNRTFCLRIGQRGFLTGEPSGVGLTRSQMDADSCRAARRKMVPFIALLDESHANSSHSFGTSTVLVRSKPWIAEGEKQVMSR